MRKGFTLMEMVLVMGVVVIIFLLTIPNIQKTMEVVNRKGCDAQLKIIDAAILQYYLKQDATATDIEQLIREGFITERQSKCSDGSDIHISNGQATQ